MIIYSKEPLNVMMKNILLLDDPYMGGYVYVSKETYDQAISLSITFNQDVGRVKGTISGKGMLNWAANKVVSHVVSLCSEHMTNPINMLAPYLAYTLPIGIEWPEDDKEIIAMAYGVLHQMSQFTNFYGTALMPAGSKAEISIPKNIIMAYEESWKAQIETLNDCVVAVPIFVDVSESISGSPLMYSQVSDGTVSVPVVHQAPVSPAPIVAATQTVPVATQPAVPEPVTEVANVGSADSGNESSSAQDAPAVEAAVTEKKEEVRDVQTRVQSEDDVIKEKTSEASNEPAEENNEAQTEEDGDEGEEEDMEAKILAMMKAIEDAPAEEFQPKDTVKPAEASKPETGTKKDEESVKFGESGSINMTEREIAEGNRRLLSDYDI